VRSLTRSVRPPALQPSNASVDLTDSRKAASESIKAVSRQLGHGTLDITLRVLAHLLQDSDNALAERLQKMFG
jgi:hypothetical protein